VSQFDSKVHMGTLTAGEARELYAHNPVILLPMGGLRDQGPHMPTGDYLLAEKLAEFAAIRATQKGVRTLVAPVLPYGGADWFGTMPGEMAISSATLALVIADLIQSLLRRGLTRLIVINGHNSNCKPIADVTRTVYRESGRLVPSIYLWRIGYGLLPRILGADKAAKSAGHGADPLTSIGMHVLPQWIRPDLMPNAMPLKHEPILGLPFKSAGVVTFEGSEIDLQTEIDHMYNIGMAAGDPHLCSAETGAALTEELTALCSNFIEHYARKIPS
jgi:creatinine amidohydrolase